MHSVVSYKFKALLVSMDCQTVPLTFKDNTEVHPYFTYFTSSDAYLTKTKILIFLALEILLEYFKLNVWEDARESVFGF